MMPLAMASSFFEVIMKILAVALTLGILAGCAPQGRFERAGSTVDDSIDDVREGVKDVVDDVRDTAEDVGDNVARRRAR
jgi:outer membrane murein-binding lipoprotein Lpp